MRKLLKDMNRDELQELFEHNRHFRQEAFEHATQSVYFWIEEYTHDLPARAADYEFGVYCRSYFTIRDADEVLIWLEKAQKAFCLLSDDEYIKAEAAWAMRCKLLYEVNNMTEEEEDATQAEYEKTLDIIADCVRARLAGEYEYFENDENVFEYAYEMLESIFSEDAYILQGEKEYAIYETVVLRHI